MSSRGGTRGARGARGARAGRGGRGGSAVAAVDARPSIEEATPSAVDEHLAAGNGDHESILSVSGTSTPITVDSQSPAPSTTRAPVATTRGGRFKPKNIRRDAIERQKLEDERNRDLAAKIKVEEKEQRDADRRARRGGRGRGRGDAAGHFLRRAVPGAGGSYSGFSQDMFKKDGGAWGQAGGFKGGAKMQYGARYHDRRGNDVRVNIDALRESDISESAQKDSKSPGFFPVGIVRIEHQPEEIKVATSAELEAEEQEDDDDDELFVSAPDEAAPEPESHEDDDIEHTAAKQPADAKDIKVKSEPGMAEEDAMDIDSIPIKPKAPPSPELQKKPIVTDLEKDSKTLAKEKKKQRALRDPEVQAMAVDAQALLEGLTLNEPAEENDQPAEDSKDGRLFLFQFPPILPPLLHVNADGSEVVEFNDEHQNDRIKIKTEPGTSGPISTGSALPAGGGYIGKLNVRKSGKVELDWGGRILELGIATETDFLTTAIIVDENESDLPSGQGKATGMGRVYGKFVATPVFQEEDEWNPDLEALGLSV
ncbi:RNA polymerase III RPC4-domain-containing protein [Xylariales sp. PMI_506]|nr:RNA polymerase III RPC4-domain-containing protein [Xylariales sp. PMI_506]